MARINIEIPDELCAQAENLSDLLPQLLQQHFQQRRQPHSGTQDEPVGIDPQQVEDQLRERVSDLEILLETVTEHSTELENQLEVRNQQLVEHLADLEVILETVTDHSTELENQLDDKNRELMSYFYEVEKVTAAAAAYENNTFTVANLSEVADRHDPLGQLARVFQDMVDQIRAREEKLAQQVRKLTIQIDRTKRDQEVTHIVESDMFKALKDKADQLRRETKQHLD